jgi:starch synthase
LRITYTSTNRAHHYPYAVALHRAGLLHAFVTGFSRWSPRAALPDLGERLIRCDGWQNLYLAALRLPLPVSVPDFCNRASKRAIDRRVLGPARESDVFLYYRTTGLETTRQLHREKSRTLCVLEEVNSHVDECDRLIKEEYTKFGRGPSPDTLPERALLLQAYEQADCILCPSNFVKRSFLARGFPEEKLLTVNFGITIPDRGRFAPAPKQADVFRLLYVGQINFRKGLRYAIKAFGRLRHPRKEFVIVGSHNKITGLEGIHLPDGIRFTGPLKGAALDDAYNSATAFVLPTIEEGLALVQGEALAAGLPLITTTNSGGEDLMANGREGFIVPAASEDALWEAMQKLADSPDLCRQMGEAARIKAHQLGGWDEVVQRLAEALSGAYERKFGHPPCQRPR